MSTSQDEPINGTLDTSKLKNYLSIIVLLVLLLIPCINCVKGGLVKKLFGIKGVKDKDLAHYEEIPKPMPVEDFKHNLSNDIEEEDLAKEIPEPKSVDDVEHNLNNDTKDKDLAKEIPEPKSVDDFKHNVNNYIEGKTVEKFFARDDPFLHKLAEKASILANDTSTDLSKPENINRLTRLSLYQTVIYCDDSGSMGIGRRYADQKELVTRIARVATRIVPDDDAGVYLQFINASGPSSKLDAAGIQKGLNAVHPKGGTKIGTNLRSKILEPLVYKTISTTSPNGPSFKRPLLICVITDGDPTQEADETLQNAIVECKKTLVDAGYEATAVMFCVSQIGDEPKAKAFIDGLRNNPLLKDVLYCTTDQLDTKFQQMQADERGLESWLLHLLTGPIMERDAA